MADGHVGTLAWEMKALRLQSGKSGREMAAALGWAPSKVSRLETGRQAPSAGDIDAWVQVADAGASHHVRDSLHKLRTESTLKPSTPPATAGPDAVARARNEGFTAGVQWVTDEIVKALRTLPGGALVLAADVLSRALAEKGERS